MPVRYLYIPIDLALKFFFDKGFSISKELYFDNKDAMRLVNIKFDSYHRIVESKEEKLYIQVTTGYFRYMRIGLEYEKLLDELESLEDNNTPMGVLEYFGRY